jgi:hypothetical protein
MKLSEIIREVIAKARAANQGRVANGSEDDSPIVTSGSYTSMTKALTTEERRLREFLQAQPPSVVYMLTAIMYLGRGDFDPKDLLDQYTEISETFGGPKGAGGELFEKMLLPEFLEAGLQKLTHAGVDVDKLPVNGNQ